jgi:Ca2+/Na+ antiporter
LPVALRETESVNQSTLINIAIAVALVGWLLARQMQARPVRSDRPYRRPLIFGVIGVIELSSFSKQHHLNSATWVVLGVSLVSAALFGLLRGSQVRVWYDGRQLWRKGNLLTCALWLVGIAIHLLIDQIGASGAGVPDGFGAASIPIYLAVSLGVQQLVIVERASRLTPAPAPALPFTP